MPAKGKSFAQIMDAYHGAGLEAEAKALDQDVNKHLAPIVDMYKAGFMTTAEMLAKIDYEYNVVKRG